MDKNSDRTKDEQKHTVVFDISEPLAKIFNRIFKHYTKVSNDTAKILKEIKEIKKDMTNQAQIDALAARLEKGNEDLSAALTTEAAEIKAAIESSKVDTTRFEAAVARSEQLDDDVKNLFTPDAPPEEPPVDEPPVDEPTEPEF